MEKIISLSAVLFFLAFWFGCGKQAKPELTEQIKSGLKTDAQQFLQSLKSILIKEMQTNGVAASVSVCSDTAQIITNNYGMQHGVYIKRVSIKNRNPNNLPDELETKAIMYFEDLKSAGKLNEATEFFDLSDIDGVTSVRYLKPIIMQAPCLNCHGNTESMLPEVKTIISKKYPNDKATGYQIDDLRGAVSIKKVL
jgi:hypothetical protein